LPLAFDRRQAISGVFRVSGVSGNAVRAVCGLHPWGETAKLRTDRSGQGRAIGPSGITDMTDMLLGRQAQRIIGHHSAQKFEILQAVPANHRP
jgi:hypothetical protein